MRFLSRRVMAALLAGTAVAGLLAARSFVSFAPTRVRLVKTSTAATGGSVAVYPTDQPAINQLRTPFAAIVRIRNQSDGAGTFRVELDGKARCETDVPPRASRRLDCVVSDNWSPQGPHTVTVTSATSAWSVEYLELATHFGASYGVLDLYVLPAGRAVERAGPVRVVGTWLIVVLLLLGIRPSRSRLVLRITYGVVVGLVGVLFATVWIAPWISIYQIALSPRSILRLTAVLLVPQLWTIALAAWRHDYVRPVRQSALARQVAVALLVATAFALVMRSRLDQTYGGNYSGFLTVARDNFDRNPQLSQRADIRASLWLQDGGYDAEFMYFAVFDPFMRVYRDTPKRYGEFIDFPPYRYSRIGFSLLTKAAALDRWQWYPAAMIWLILLGLFATSFIVAGIARDQGASPFWGATVLLVPGFWRSLQSGLPEPLAAAFLLGGYWALTRKRWLVAGACFAACLLTRETEVVVIGVLLAGTFLSGCRREAWLAGLVAAVPLAIWRIYVGLTFFSGWGWEAFFPTPHDMEVPFKGVIDLWRVVARGAYFPGVPDLVASAIYYPLLLIAACGLVVTFVIRRPSALAIANVFYATVAMCFSYGAVWLHVGNAERITYELFVLLAIGSIEASRARGMRIAVYGFWAVTALYVFGGTFDAAFVRHAIVPFF